jgi:hypothetical protein
MVVYIFRVDDIECRRLWALDDGCVLMDSRRARAPSSAMVTSMASLLRGFTLV